MCCAEFGVIFFPPAVIIIRLSAINFYFISQNDAKLNFYRMQINSWFNHDSATSDMCSIGGEKYES